MYPGLALNEVRRWILEKSGYEFTDARDMTNICLYYSSNEGTDDKAIVSSDDGIDEKAIVPENSIIKAGKYNYFNGAKYIRPIENICFYAGPCYHYIYNKCLYEPSVVIILRNHREKQRRRRVCKECAKCDVMLKKSADIYGE